MLLPPFQRKDAISRDVVLIIDLAADKARPPQYSAESKEEHCHIPDQPTIPTRSFEVRPFLTRELSTPALDEMYGSLWLIAAMSGSRIDALHESIVKGRQIVVVEDPAMHLTWYKDKIFVKPMPRALFNYDFWQHFLASEASFDSVSDKQGNGREDAVFDRKIALGFVRSYAFLIRHRSDLNLAHHTGLLPSDVAWDAWIRFITPFTHLSDGCVAKRYHFGQLRITRLNMLTRFVRPRYLRSHRHYREMHWDSWSWIERFIAPLIFVFASISVVLSAMQVMVSVPAGQEGVQSILQSIDLVATSSAFWIFGLIVVCFNAVCWLGFVIGPLGYFSTQMIFGRSMRNKSIREIEASGKNIVP